MTSRLRHKLGQLAEDGGGRGGGGGGSAGGSLNESFVMVSSIPWRGWWVRRQSFGSPGDPEQGEEDPSFSDVAFVGQSRGMRRRRLSIEIERLRS